jgi:ABC-type xylose transport system substrate-binding protein
MSTHSSEELEAVQNVVDRVTSWQDGATEGTVESELRRGLDEAGVALADEEIASLASVIEDEHGAIDAAEVLGR